MGRMAEQGRQAACAQGSARHDNLQVPAATPANLASPQP
jgi:hypothetical protein